MQVGQNVSLNWSKRIPSTSGVRNPLGIWSDHLQIQTDFTKGLTSVTFRARYYTLLAWYYENVYSENDEKISLADFEKLFILICLAHHEGKPGADGLLRVYDKENFGKAWEKQDTFNLEDFKISGFGRSYYNNQLAVLKCAWIDGFTNKFIKTSLNHKLANSLDFFDHSFFKKQITKDELKKLVSFCACNISSNEKEIEILSKLFFGFFCKKNGDWDIDEKEYKDFMEGRIDLNFEENVAREPTSFEDTSLLSPDYSFFEDPAQIRNAQLKRRNTLFLFLKIIKETNPPENYMAFRQSIWDAIYFKQRQDLSKIDFGTLERARSYWEYFHLNVYYVYALEKFLDVIQKIVIKNPGTQKSAVLNKLDEERFFNRLSDRLNKKINTDSRIVDIIQLIDDLTVHTTKTQLGLMVNEAQTFKNIEKSSCLEDQLAEILILMCLLYHRYEKTAGNLKNLFSCKGFSEQISIHTVFSDIKNSDSELSVFYYLTKLVDKIVNVHLSEASLRLSTGVKKWIFTEENNELYPARKKLVKFEPRDNRWGSMKSLLLDLQFIQKKDSKIVLTDKGKEWLNKIE